MIDRCKRCPSCLETKSILEFQNRGTHPPTYCKPCARKRRTAWTRRQRQTNPEWWQRRQAYMRIWSRRMVCKSYGMTLEDYERLISKQGGKCAICMLEEKGRKLTIDHDHVTGRVRGLLCRKCNRAIGVFHEDVAILARAIAYLALPNECVA